MASFKKDGQICETLKDDSVVDETEEQVKANKKEEDLGAKTVRFQENVKDNEDDEDDEKYSKAKRVSFN